jgi:hypothetical protein
MCRFQLPFQLAQSQSRLPVSVTLVCTLAHQPQQQLRTAKEYADVEWSPFTESATLRIKVFKAELLMSWVGSNMECANVPTPKR